MPPRAFGRAATKAPSNLKTNIPAKEDKPIDAPPDSSSDEENAAAPDIQRTVFEERSKSSRNAQANAPPSSSSSSSSTKRKSSASQGDRWGMVDPFGRVTGPQKKKINQYGTGSIQRRVTSSQSASKAKKVAGSPEAPRFQNYDLPSELHSSPCSPTKTLAGKFKIPVGLEDSPSTQGVAISFQIPKQVEDFSVTASKGSEPFTNPLQLEETPTSTQSSVKTFVQPSPNPFPLKRNPKKLLDLKNYDLGGDLASRIKNIVGQEESGADSAEMFEDEFDVSITVAARCPLCKQPCSIDELKRWGSMNTRQQERFCRSHRKTAAEKRWNSKGYPEIDWEKLESRIAAHHDFIKNLLDGAECHYRKAFEELVAAGKGRSLRKMESNLIPGYYGSRGLNMISDHVIREFSEPLSERSVNDGLISKRGTTAFIQSVIVPEVTVKLIMEDMSIDDERARNVLSESTNIGELVHEEVKDVVVERIENSDDDDDDENERPVEPSHVAGESVDIRSGI